MSSIKEHIQGQAIFQHYQDGKLWYKTSTTGLLFPVPIVDLDNAKALSVEKGMFFMKWIKKWLKEVENARKEQK